MTSSFRSVTVGDIAVVKCEGQIVEGTAVALRQHVTDMLEQTTAIVLDLRGVTFIDSSGLGVLVRILARTGQDNLKLCGLNSRIAEMLRITRLSNVFDCHESEADAIAAFYRGSPGSSGSSPFVAPNVLCIANSDLLTYMREVLRHAGVSVTTTDNLSDAVTLLKATAPKVVLVAHELRSAGSTGIVETFNRLVETLAAVELPPDFARRDPTETGPELVERVRVLIASA
jgi:anti-sigma B factor antagonist